MSKEELKKLMREMRYSRKDFAERLEISIHTLDSWIQGKREVPKTMSALINLTFTQFDKPEQDPVLEAIERLSNMIIRNDDLLSEGVKQTLLNTEKINMKSDDILENQSMGLESLKSLLGDIRG